MDDGTSGADRLRDDPAVKAMLERICADTAMGFAAVARVTDKRWVACQVLDRIEFGLEAGDELALQTTICDDIRQSGNHGAVRALRPRDRHAARRDVLIAQQGSRQKIAYPVHKQA